MQMVLRETSTPETVKWWREIRRLESSEKIWAHAQRGLKTMTQKPQTFPEYLGDISTVALLQNITDAQAEIFSSIERLRTKYSRGFAITAHFAALGAC